MKEKKFISSKISEFMESDSHFLFFSMSSEQIELTREELKNHAIVADMQDDKIKLTPLSPFPFIVHEAGIPLKKITEKTYPLHRNIMESFFYSGFCNERYDLPLLDEIPYEKTRFVETFIELVNEIETPIAILNAQDLSDDAIDILKNAGDKNLVKNKFIICFNIEERIDFDSKSKLLFLKVRNSDNYYSIAKRQTKSLFKVTKKKTKTVEEEPVNGIPIFSQYYSALHNMRMFFAFDQGNKFIEYLMAKTRAMDFTHEQYRLLHFEAALIYLYQKRFADAKIIISRVIALKDDDEIYFLSLIYLSLLLNRIYQYDKAINYSTLALSYAKNSKCPLHDVLANFAHYRNLITERKEVIFKKYLGLLKKLYSTNLPNLTIETAINVPWYFDQSKDTLSEILQNIDIAMKIAEEVGNYFALSTVCHWKGVLLSRLNKKNEAFNSLRRCNAIRNKLGNPLSMVKIRNGLSYEYLLNCDYLNAYDVINSFLKRITEIDDYSETLITLANVAKILFYTHNETVSAQIFNYIETMVNSHSVKDLRVCSVDDIHVYRACIDISLGFKAQAKKTLEILNKNSNVSVSVMPVKMLLEAEISVSEGDVKKGIEIFNSAIDYINKNCAEQQFLKAYIYFQFPIFLLEADREDEAEEIWQAAKKMAMEKHLDFYSTVVCNQTISEYANYRIKFSPLTINFAFLDQVNSKEILASTLVQRNRDFYFLAKISKKPDGCTSIPEYLEFLVEEVHNYFEIGAVYFYKKVDDEWKTITTDSRAVIEEPSSQSLDQLLLRSRSVGSDLVFDSEKRYVFADLSEGEETYGVFFACLPDKYFSTEIYGTMGQAVTVTKLYIQNFIFREKLQSPKA
ncbi:MAG: hypothetical protein K6G52_05565 [Treponemataceae bacterium]|nr:hypothetical protein [Treponemataceae bacterium]